jgi:glycosyltransferase involved in cell wall biosynthesis
VQEARVLGKPIVITNFATAAEHVTHMSDGIVADMNASSLAEALELLIRDEKLRCRIAREPDATAFDAELEKILALIPSNRRAVNTVPDPAFV